MKQPYFTTADGVAVKGTDTVFCIGVSIKDGSYLPFRDRCMVAVRQNSECNIFSTRAAAQAECDKRNKL